MANELFEDVRDANIAATPKPHRVWSEYQKAIFGWFAVGRRHLVVEAVAGGSKTSTAVEGLSYVPRGTRCLMLAFNKSTAEDLKARVPGGVDVMTCHGLGFRAVGHAWKSLVGRVTVDDKRELKLAREIAPTWAPDDHGAVCRLVAFAKAWVASTTTVVERLAAEYEVRPRDVSNDEFVAVALAILEASRQPSGAISYDDMIYLPVVLGLRPLQYDLVVIDEVQDLSAAQRRLAVMACRSGGRICGIGDRKQAIYGWRGADTRSIQLLVEQLDADTLPLSVTYRCPRAVVAHVRHIVPQLEAAPGAAEGEVHPEVTVREMLAGWRTSDFVVSRTNAPLVRLCLRAWSDGTPAYVLGRDVGQSVRALVERYRGASIAGLLKFCQQCLAEEHDRLKAADKLEKFALAQDRVDVVEALADGLSTPADLLRRLDALFSDDNRSDRITFSSIHRIKGREARRVWLLEGTCRQGASAEEDNLYYVACTRAQQQLMLVDWDGRSELDC